VTTVHLAQTHRTSRKGQSLLKGGGPIETSRPALHVRNRTGHGRDCGSACDSGTPRPGSKIARSLSSPAPKVTRPQIIEVPFGMRYWTLAAPTSVRATARPNADWRRLQLSRSSAPAYDKLYNGRPRSSTKTSQEENHPRRWSRLDWGRRANHPLRLPNHRLLEQK